MDTSPAPPSIRVTFQDVLDGRAYLRLPLVSKLLLCHMAGAPWSEKDKGAFLHPLQVEVIAHKEREKLVHGASRLGKSVLGGCDLLCAGMMPFRKLAVVAKRYMHMGHEWQYLHAGMRKLFAKHGQAFKRLVFRNHANNTEAEIDTIWGTSGLGISVESDEGAQLLGREITDVVIGEGSHVPAYIFNTKLLRALDGAAAGQRAHGGEQHIGSISIYTTPREFEGCSAAEWERVHRQTGRKPELLNYGNVSWSESVWIRAASILENPAYSRKVYEARKKTLDKNAFAEQYGGQMTFSTGRVYQSFDDDKHVIPMPAIADLRKMRLAIGVDTGAYFAFSLLGKDHKGRKFILGESYDEKPRGGFPTAAENAEAMLVRVLNPVFGTEEVAHIIQRLYLHAIDPASQHKAELIDRWDVGLVSPSTSDTRSVIQTTGRIERWFQSDELFIVDSCDYTLDQYRKYVWKHVKAPTANAAPVVKEPNKVYDHLCDASRFGLVCLDDSGPVDATEVAVVSFAEAWESHARNRFFAPLKAAMERGAQREASWMRRNG